MIKEVLSIIKLTLLRFIRRNRLIALFFLILYGILLYQLIFLKEFESSKKIITLIVSYIGVLLTGGLLKDEINQGYIDILFTGIKRSRIILGKFFGISLIVITYYFSPIRF